MSISFSGLASGLDTSSWVESLVSLKQAKVDSLEEEKKILQQTKEVVSSIRTFFESFRSTLNKITDSNLFKGSSMDIFAQNLAISSNASIATAFATAEAKEAIYELEVDKLATNTQALSGYRSSIVETTIATENTLLKDLGVTAGKIGIRNGGTTQNITITNNDSIATFIDKLGKIGVKADFQNGIFSVELSCDAIDDDIDGDGVKNTNIVEKLGLQGVNYGYETSNSLSIETTETITVFATGTTLLKEGFGVDEGKTDPTKLVFEADEAYHTVAIDDTTTIDSLVEAINNAVAGDRTVASYDEETGIFKLLGAKIINTEFTYETTNAEGTAIEVTVDATTTDLATKLGLEESTRYNHQSSGALSFSVTATTTIGVTGSTELKELVDESFSFNVDGNDDGEDIVVKNSNGEYKTITVYETTSVASVLADLSTAGLSATLTDEGTVEIKGGEIITSESELDIISVFNLKTEAYSGIVTGNSLSAVTETDVLAGASTKLVADLQISQGYIKATDASGNESYVKVYDGQSISQLCNDLKSAGVTLTLNSTDGTLTLESGALETLTDEEVQNLVDAGTITETDPNLIKGSDLVDKIFGSESVTSADGDVNATNTKTGSLYYNVTVTSNATTTTALGTLVGDIELVTGTVEFTVGEVTKTIDVTSEMSISELMTALAEQTITSSWDRNTSTLTIKDAVISGGTSNLGEILDLETTVEETLTSSNGLYVLNSSMVVAGTTTELEKFGVTDGEALKVYDADGDVVIDTTISSTTKIEDLLSIINTDTATHGVSAEYNTLTGIFTVANGHIENATLESALGLTTETGVSNAIGSSVITVTTESDVSGGSKMKDIVAALGTESTVAGGYTLFFKGNEITGVDENTSVDQLCQKLLDEGAKTAVLDTNTGKLVVEGGAVTGTLAEALGIRNVSSTVGFTGTGDTLFATSQSYADGSTKLSQLNIGDTSIEVKDSAGNTLTTLEITTNTDLNSALLNNETLKTEYGISGTISEGRITIVSDSGNYIAGALADTLGISTNVTTVTVSTSQSSTAKITSTQTNNALDETNLADIDALKDVSDFTITIRGENGTTIATATTLNDLVNDSDPETNPTLGDLMSVLESHSINVEYENGILTLTSPQGYYATGEVMTALGIGAQEGVTTTTTTGQSVTSTVVLSSTSTVDAQNSSTIGSCIAIPANNTLVITNSDGSSIVANITVDQNMTFSALNEQTKGYGVEIGMSNGSLSITSTNGNYIKAGDMADALGIDTQITTTTTTVGMSITSSGQINYTAGSDSTVGTTNTGSNALTYTTTIAAGMESTLGELGIASYELKVHEYNGDVEASTVFNSGSSLNDIDEWLNRHSMTLSIDNTGVVSITPKNNSTVGDEKYVSGSLMDAMGIGVQDNGTTTVTTYTSATGLTYSTTVAAELTSKFKDMGINQDMVINICATGNRTFDADFTTINGENSIEDLKSILENATGYDFNVDYSGNRISITSESGYYVTGLEALGIGVAEGATITTTTGESVTGSTGLTYYVTVTTGMTATSGVITYEDAQVALSSTNSSSISFADVGLNQAFTVTVMNSQTGDVAITTVLDGSTKLSELETLFTDSYGISFSYADGKATIQQDNSNYYLQSTELSNLFGINFDTQTTVAGTTSTKLSEIGVKSSNFAVAPSRISKAQAEAAGYTWVTTRGELENALANNENIVLGEDIDLGASDWNPIAEYSGTLDGNGHVIKNMTITQNIESNMSFVARAIGATFKNLGFEDVVISSNTDNANMAVIAGYSESINIENCYVDNAQMFGYENTGSAAGLIGLVQTSNATEVVNIENCNIKNFVTEECTVSTGFIGMIVPTSNNETIQCNINNSTISSSDLSGSNAAGFVGFADTGTAQVSITNSKMGANLSADTNAQVLLQNSGATVTVNNCQYDLTQTACVDGTITENNSTQIGTITNTNTDPIYVRNADGDYVGTITGLTTSSSLSDVFSALSSYGITATIDASGTVEITNNINSYNLEGEVVDKLGLTATETPVIVTVGVTTTGDAVVVDTSTTYSTFSATATTFGDLGLDSVSITVFEAGTGDVLTVISAGTDTTWRDIDESANISQYGINLSVNAGKVTISSSNGNWFRSAELESALGITVTTTSSVVTDYTLTSSGPITYGATNYAEMSSTLGEIGVSSFNDTVTILSGNSVSGIVHVTTPIALTGDSNTSLETLFEPLTNQGFIVSVSDEGRLTITDSTGAGRWVESSQLESKFGILTQQYLTGVTATVANTVSSSAQITYTQTVGIAKTSTSSYELLCDKVYNDYYSATLNTTLGQLLDIDEGAPQEVELYIAHRGQTLLGETETNAHDYHYSTQYWSSQTIGEFIEGFNAVAGGEVARFEDGRILFDNEYNVNDVFVFGADAEALGFVNVYSTDETVEGSITGSGTTGLATVNNSGTIVGNVRTADTESWGTVQGDGAKLLTIGTAVLNYNKTVEEAATTFADLGLSETGYVTVISQGTTTVLTVNSSASVESLVTQLNNLGLNATYYNTQAENDSTTSWDNKFYVRSTTDAFITGMSESLINALGFKGSSAYFGSSYTYSTVAGATAERSTTLEELGYSDSYAPTIVVSTSSGNVSVAISSTDSIGTIMNKLKAVGVSASYSNGKLSLGNSGDTSYIKSFAGTGTAELLDKLNLSSSALDYWDSVAVRQTRNTNSNKLYTDSTSQTASGSTTLATLGLSNGLKLVINDADGVAGTITLNSTDSVNTMVNALSSFNISATMDSVSGALTISGGNDGYISEVYKGTEVTCAPYNSIADEFKDAFNITGELVETVNQTNGTMTTSNSVIRYNPVTTNIYYDQNSTVWRDMDEFGDKTSYTFQIMMTDGEVEDVIIDHGHNTTDGVQHINSCGISMTYDSVTHQFTMDCSSGAYFLDTEDNRALFDAFNLEWPPYQEATETAYAQGTSGHTLTKEKTVGTDNLTGSVALSKGSGETKTLSNETTWEELGLSGKTLSVKTNGVDDSINTSTYKDLDSFIGRLGELGIHARIDEGKFEIYRCDDGCYINEVSTNNWFTNFFELDGTKYNTVTTTNSSKLTVTNAGKELEVKSTGFIQDITVRDTSTMTAFSSVDANSALAVGTYKISTTADLLKMVQMSEAGYLTSGCEFVLANDIDMTGVNWTIGIGKTNSFRGSFDGNGYTISNLNGRSGLFASTTKLADGTYAEIKNVKLTDVNLTAGNAVIGAVVNGSNYTNINNCSVIGGTISNQNRIGGIVGYTDYADTNYCYSSLNITTTSNGAGGIVGYNNRDSISSYCISDSTVNGTEHIGGLVGIGQAQYSKSSAIVTGQTEIGGISGETYSVATGNYFNGTVTGTSKVGGIAGNIYGNGTIKNFIMEGTVNGDTNVGAIVGYSTLTISSTETIYYDSQDTGATPLVGSAPSVNLVSQDTRTPLYATTTTSMTLAGVATGGEVVINLGDGSGTKTVTVESTDTFASWFGKLDGFGITGSIENGQVTLTPKGGSTSYIESVSSSLATQLGLSGDYYTVTEETLSGNTPSNYLSVTTPGTVSVATKLSQLGVTEDFVVTVTPLETGGTPTTTTISKETSIENFVSILTNDLDANASFDSATGKLTISNGVNKVESDAFAQLGLTQGTQTITLKTNDTSDAYTVTTSSSKLTVTNAGKELTVKPTGFIQDITVRDTSTMTAFSSVDANSALAVGTYKISTTADLLKMVQMSEAGYLTSGCEFVLANDINMSGINWTIGIGNTNDFSGVFDGNGYTISNLTGSSGLFNETSKLSDNTTYSKIKNVKLVNANITSTKNAYIGGIVNYATGVSIINCSVIDSTISSSGNFVGAIAGMAYYAPTSYCYTNSTVSGSNDIGGIAGGFNYSTGSFCVSEATVSGNENVGGIVGLGGASKSKSSATVTGNKDVGGISGDTNVQGEQNYFNGYVSGTENVGGYAGDVYGNGIIRNFIMEGTVNGDTNVSAIVGYSTLTISSTETIYYDSQDTGALPLVGTAPEVNLVSQDTRTPLYATTTTSMTLAGVATGGEVVINLGDGSGTKTVTVESTDTFATWFGKLDGFGITGSIENGQVTLKPKDGSTSYIESVSSNLESKLGISGPYSNVIVGSTENTINPTTTMGEICGGAYAEENATINVKVNGELKTLTITSTMTMSTLESTLESNEYGNLTVDLSNGILTITGNENAYVESVGSVVSTYLKLNAGNNISYTVETDTTGSNTTDGTHFDSTTGAELGDAKVGNLNGGNGLTQNATITYVTNGVTNTTTISNATDITAIPLVISTDGGKVTFKGDANNYIVDMSDELANLLGVEVGDGKSYTTSTSTLYTNDASNSIKVTDTGATVDFNTALSSVTGYSHGNGKIAINDNGSISYINVNKDGSIYDFAGDVLTATDGKLQIDIDEANGTVSITGDGNIKLQSVSGGSNILDILNLSDVTTVTEEITTNTQSNQLFASGNTGAGLSNYLTALVNSSGDSLEFDVNGNVELSLTVTATDGATTTTVYTFNTTHTLATVAQKLNFYHGITLDVLDGGEIAFKSNNLAGISVGGELGDFLDGNGLSITAGTVNITTTSTTLGAMTNGELEDVEGGTSITELGLTTGSIGVKDTDGNITYHNFDASTIDTKDELLDFFSVLGFNATIADGKVSLSNDNGKTLVALDEANGGTNLLEKLGITDWTVADVQQTSNSIQISDSSTAKIQNMNVYLSSLTDSTGASLGITAGQIYKYDDGVTPTLVTIDEDETLESLKTKLGSNFDVQLTNGVLYITGTGNSYLTTDGIESGASNILTQLGIEDWTAKTTSTSKALQAEAPVKTLLTNDKLNDVKLLELKDSSGNPIASAGDITIVANGNPVIKTIDENTTVQEFLSWFDPDAFDVSFANGAITINGKGNSYIEGTDDDSTPLGKMFNDTTTSTGVTSESIKILDSESFDPNIVKLKDLQVDTPITEGWITVVKDGVSNNVEINENMTVQQFINATGLTGSVNANNQIVFTSNGNDCLKTCTDPNKTASNVLDVLGIGEDKWDNTYKYTSKSALVETTTEAVTGEVTEDTLLVGFDKDRDGEGVTAGEFYIYNNGVQYKAMISSGDTFGDFIDTLRSFGLQAGLVNGNVVISGSNGGNSYIATSESTFNSNVVEELFATGTNDTYTEYSGVLQQEQVNTIITSAEPTSKIKDFCPETTVVAGTLAFTVNGDPCSVEIDENETFESLIDKLGRIGIKAKLTDGKFQIHSGFDDVEIITDPNKTTSGIVDALGIDVAVDENGDPRDLGGYSQSKETLIAQVATDTILSAANYANKTTKLSDLNISQGAFTVYRDGQKAQIEIEENETFASLETKIQNILGSDVKLEFKKSGTDLLGNSYNEDGILRIYSTTEGIEIKTGSTTDNSNFAAITGLISDGEGGVRSAREMYNVHGNSKLTTSGLFRIGDITEGTFKIGDAEFEITNTTTLNDLINMINTNDAANATAYWDNIKGQFVIKSQNSGASLLNIEAGTSNFTDIMGFTKTENGVSKLVIENQELGQNAEFSINGVKYTSTSNTIDSSVTRIEGLTINLKNVTPEGEPITIKVEKDKDTLGNAIQDVVDSYNQLMKNIDKQIAINGALHDETTLKYIRDRIWRLMTSSELGTQVFKNLDAIGISSAEATEGNVQTGDSVVQLKFDKEKFYEAYQGDPNSVRELLLGKDEDGNGQIERSTGELGIFNEIEALLEDSVLAAVTGYFDATTKSYNSRISSLDNKINKATISIERYRARLEKKFASMDLLIGNIQNQYSSFLGTSTSLLG